MHLLKRPDVRYPTILAALALLLWAPRLHGPIDVRYDGGVYYLLGTSLAEGKGYRILSEPGEIQAIQYPPLLPAFVAALQKATGTSDIVTVGRWLRWSYCAIFIAYALAVYVLARQFLRPGYAFAVGLICTLSCDSLYLSDLLYAEVPFALITTLFVICSVLAHRAFKVSGDVEARPWRQSLLSALAGILGAAAYLLRSAGVALLAAWVGEALLRRQWKQAALRGVIALVPLVGWQAWVAHVKHAPEYKTPAYAFQRSAYLFYNVTYMENLRLIDPFKPELGKASGRQWVQRVLENIKETPVGIAGAITVPKPFWQWALDQGSLKLGRKPGDPILPWNSVDIPLVFLGGLVIVGLAILAVRRQWLVPLYLLASVAIICLTPWPKQLARYFSPLAPFLALSLVLSLASFRNPCAKLPNRFMRAAATAIFACVVGAVVLIEVIADVSVLTVRRSLGPTFPSPGGPVAMKLFYYDEAWVSLDSAIDWLKQNTQSDDVIATSVPHLAYLKTGRRAVFTPMEAKAFREMQMLDSVPVQYVMIGSLGFLDVDQRYLAPMIAANPAAWQLVYSAPDKLTRVYRRVGK